MAETKEVCVVQDEDEIDMLKMVKSIRLCRQNDIDLTDKPTLDEMKLRLKLKLLCTEGARDQEMTKLENDYSIDETRRHDLCELFEKIAETTRNVLNLDDPVVKELRQNFPDIDNVLKREIQSLQKSYAPILVLGETGAGKSSFINLLLAQDILPSSMLSNTHVVCEIKYGKEFSAILYPLDTSDCPKYIHNNGDIEEFRRDLAIEIQRLDKGRGVYKMAEIFLPCAILKSGVVLVDSPGIGETKEMESMVLDYIFNACTFIYIISSDSAGGVQQRVKDLLDKVCKKALHEQKAYQPDRAIFVCNKWDQVPPNERNDVKEDTIKKIMASWKDCKKDQIFPFSTKEAAFMQKRDRLSPKFGLVMKEINKLIPLGREIQIVKSYQILDYFVKRCLHCFQSKLEQIKMSAPERHNKQTKTKQRLQVLKEKVDSFFIAEMRTLKQSIGQLADKLKDFLREEKNMAIICKFTKSDFSRKEEWKTVAVAIRAKVSERIISLIKGWEEEKGEIKKIGDQISNSLDKEFPKFTAEIFDVQCSMSSAFVNTHGMEDNSLVPEVVRKQFEGLNTGMKVAVGIGLAPVLLLGMAIRLPVFGLESLKQLFSNVKMQSKLKKASDQESELALFEEYARSMVDKITDQLELRNIIEADITQLFTYLHNQKTKVEGLIKSEMELLNQMLEEDRNDREIKKTYEPLHLKFLMLQKELENFIFTNMPHRLPMNFQQYSPDCLSDWTGRTEICNGLEAKIYPTTLREDIFSGTFRDVCVRVMSEKIKPTNFEKRKGIEEAYRDISKSFMVRYIGLTVGPRNHFQILEQLDCNLREFLPRRYDDFRTVESFRFYLQGVARHIVHGLNFLHERSLVHYDLSQDTIAVDVSGTIKLTNICVPKLVHVKPDCIDGRIDLSQCIYIPEKFIFGKERSASLSSISSNSDVSQNGDSSVKCDNYITDTTKTFQKDKYGPQDDMYSMGMLMWEIWVRKPLYGEDPWLEVAEDIMNDTDKLKNLLNRFRPTKHPDFVSSPESEMWWTTIDCCMNGKLNAKNWLSRWEEITYTYPNISLVESS